MNVAGTVCATITTYILAGTSPSRGKDAAVLQLNRGLHLCSSVKK